jgi:hypothetical protein
MSPPTTPDATLNQRVLRLDPERIVYTISRLERRVDERFPSSGLAGVCAHLRSIGEQTVTRLDDVERPNLWLRSATWVMAGLVGVGLLTLVWQLVPELRGSVTNVLDALQVLETGIQDIVFIGFGLVFLITVENRLRRRSALEFIRELRAVAHIVDMHQLTKDPAFLLRPASATDSSPTRTYTRNELSRYLDYCSEMLSLTSKLAALYAERLSDSVVLQAVDEVETLTTGLSGKIWQKIMILDQEEPGQA